MSKFQLTTLVLVIMIALIIPITSCTSTSELLPLSNNPAKAEASVVDYEARIAELEMRVERLEQGLDARVIEFNIVQSALWEMVIDNKLGYGIPGNSFPYTNDMRQFPSPTAPLYGFDKNGDGKPDTNYVPFETTEWFYQADSDVPDLLIQGPDLQLIESWQRDIGRGVTEAYETELHNIQTAVMAMLADSDSGRLDSVQTNISDMDLITADGGTKRLSSYLTGLNPDSTVKTGCIYSFALDGTVTQKTPIPPPQETYETELHNIQTAVMAMLADSTTGNVTAGTGIPQTDMHYIQSRDSHGTLYLSDYLTGLNGTLVQSGCTYTVTPDGTVTQTKP